MGETGENQPALLVLDTSYTLEMIKERGVENSVLCRDLNGYFRHVWSVHPFATLLTSESWTPRYGQPVSHELGPRHTFIEGKVGRFAALKRFFPLNFLLSQFKLLTQLVGLVRRERVAVIRVGDPLYLGILGWILSKLTGAAFAIRVNGNYDKIRETTGQPIFPRLFPSVKLEKKVERFILPRAQLVFAPNDDNAQFAIANGADRRAIQVVGFGSLLADEHFTEPEKRTGAEEALEELGLTSGEYLLCIGRLEPPKLPDHVIRVLAGVRDLRPGLKAVFVGEGTMRAELQELSRMLGVADSVVLAGNRDQLFLSRLIPHAAVVLSPITGRALSEAALGAAPIVAYDTDWQKDMIETDVTGILVPYRDHDAMAEAVARFLRDPALAKAMGGAVRNRALAMLDPAAGIAVERASYERLLAGRRSS